MHVAIIPDGNRRWAKEKGLAATKGYEIVARRTAEKNPVIIELIRRAKSLGITTFSLWVFSTDNWKRPQEEKDKLFTLLQEHIRTLKETLQEQKARFEWVGRRTKIAQELREELESLEQEHNKGEFTFQLCLDYGGRDELLRAINKAVKEGKEQDEESFKQHLDTSQEPDIIIRTSGEHRLSGFMPWQSVYSELFFVNKHFPDFTADDLEDIIKEFSLRARRYGGA